MTSKKKQQPAYLKLVCTVHACTHDVMLCVMCLEFALQDYERQEGKKEASPSSPKADVSVQLSHFNPRIFQQQVTSLCFTTPFFHSFPQGPPPDPSYSFLADRSREGPQSSRSNDVGGRRHPRNWGGPSFHGVKSAMRNEKDRQVRGRAAGGTDSFLFLFSGLGPFRFAHRVNLKAYNWRHIWMALSSDAAANWSHPGRRWKWPCR